MNVHSTCAALGDVPVNGQQENGWGAESVIAVQQETGARGRIVAAARHLFSTQGFHQTSMAELAHEARVSVGAIYRLFKGKADIIEAIVQEDSAGRLEEITELHERVRMGILTIEAALTQIALRALSGGDEALSFEILAEAHRNPEVASMITDLCLHYRSGFRDLVQLINPDLSDIHLNAAEELLLACMFGLGHRNLSSPRLGAPETAALTARMIIDALSGMPPGK